MCLFTWLSFGLGTAVTFCHQMAGICFLTPSSMIWKKIIIPKSNNKWMWSEAPSHFWKKQNSLAKWNKHKGFCTDIMHLWRRVEQDRTDCSKNIMHVDRLYKKSSKYPSSSGLTHPYVKCILVQNSSRSNLCRSWRVLKTK